MTAPHPRPDIEDEDDLPLRHRRREGLEGYRARGLDGPAVVGELAASLALVPPGSRLSAAELVQTLRPADLERCLRGTAADGAEGLGF